MDERFTQFTLGESLGNRPTTFQNELLAIDMDVKRLQVAYLNTILMPRIDGLVTGNNKNVGDQALPGEIVIRVESTSQDYLGSTLIYGSVITVNQSQMALTTTFWSDSARGPLTDKIVAAWGRPSGDDRWEMVVLYDNGGGTSASPTPVLPLNYSFDFNDTSFTLA